MQSSVLLRRSAVSAAAPAVRRAFVRSYATPAAELSVQDAAGIKLATVAGSTSGDSATAAITVVVKAGSRHEASPGLAHVLKNSLFKGTHKRSAIRLVRETEMYGAVLSSALTREALVLTAEFIKGDEAFFTEVLGDALTQAKFAVHEYNEEVLPAVAAEYEASVRSPAHHALDLAHSLAFRTGLGSSLFADPHTAVDHAQTIAFANSAFGNPSNVAIASTGVESTEFQSLVSEFFVSGAAASAAPATTSASAYYGGDLRVPSVLHSASPSDHLLIAFKGADVNSSANLTVLKHLLGGESSIKWSRGSSPLSVLSTSALVSAQAFNLSYSDAGLFGVMLKAPTAHMGALASKVVVELKNVAQGATKPESLLQAIAKAKFAAAIEFESKVGRLESVGSQLLISGSVKSLDTIFAEFDKVTVESVTKAAAAALASKASTVAIGDVHKLPYIDSLGL